MAEDAKEREEDRGAIGRRRLAKVLAVSGGAMAAHLFLPKGWSSPLVNVGPLPAHADGSFMFGDGSVFVTGGGDFEITHTYGGSPCPTPMGTITIENTSGTDRPFSVDAPAFILADPPSGSIPAGGSVTIEFSFNCNMAVSQSGSMTVTVDGMSTSYDVAVNVVGAP